VHGDPHRSHGDAIGVLGGTFDPVHNAHLAMARAALDALSLKEILFVPTGTPRYRNPPVASAEHRVAMLKLALQGDPRYRIDERELAPGASGYTADTLRGLRSEIGSAAQLYLLMGADQYAALPTWHRPDEVKKLARIAVFARPGFKAIGKDAEMVPMQPLPISASEIRARAARRESLSGFVPQAVAGYIARHGLYA
jgi:nicotinate-nucleotide adenylyltransferase